MRLVVIDAAKRTYRVYQDRQFLIEYITRTEECATAEQVEEIRMAEPPPVEAA